MKHRFSSIVSGFASLLVMTSTMSRAAVVYDNLNQTSGGGDAVGPGGLVEGPLYNSFSTGTGSGFLLSGVQLLLSNGGGSSGSTSIGIYDTNGGTIPPSPGSLIEMLGTVTESNLSGAASVWNVSLAAPLLLAASTQYWVGLSTNNGAQMQWWYASSSDGTGVAGEFFSNHTGSFANLGNGPYQMSVSVTAIPEPSTSLLSVVGATMLLRRRRK